MSVGLGRRRKYRIFIQKLKFKNNFRDLFLIQNKMRKDHKEMFVMTISSEVNKKLNLFKLLTSTE